MAKTPRSILDLLDAQAPAVGKAFKESIDLMAGDIRVSLLEDALRRRSVEDVLSLTELKAAHLAPLRKTLRNAYESGGDLTLGQMRSQAQRAGVLVGAVGHFDGGNPRAEKWLSSQSSKLITEINSGQRQVIRALMGVAQEQGYNPRKTALDIAGRVSRPGQVRQGGVIGLTSGQNRWAIRAEAELTSGSPRRMSRYLGRKLRDKRFDSIVRKAIREGRPVSQKDASRLVSRYRSRILRYRGEVIARTEAMQALHAAQFEGLQQIIDNGAVKKEHVMLEWDASADAFTRSSHRFMDGQVREKGKPFTSGLGNRMLHPGDRSLGAPAADIIQCRCIARPKVDFIAAAAQQQGAAPTPPKPQPKPRVLDLKKPKDRLEALRRKAKTIKSDAQRRRETLSRDLNEAIESGDRDRIRTARERVESEANDNPILNRITSELNGEQKMARLAAKEFEDFDGDVQWRALGDRKFTDANVDGQWLGQGIYGDGMYFQAQKGIGGTEVFHDVVKTMHGYSYSENGTIFRTKLRKDAKTISAGKLRKEALEEMADSNGNLKAEWKEVLDDLGVQPGTDDASQIFALVRGYDAVTVPDMAYTVMLNRRRLVADADALKIGNDRNFVEFMRKRGKWEAEGTPTPARNWGEDDLKDYITAMKEQAEPKTAPSLQQRLAFTDDMTPAQKLAILEEVGGEIREEIESAIQATEKQSILDALSDFKKADAQVGEYIRVNKVDRGDIRGSWRAASSFNGNPPDWLGHDRGLSALYLRKINALNTLKTANGAYGSALRAATRKALEDRGVTFGNTIPNILSTTPLGTQIRKTLTDHYPDHLTKTVNDSLIGQQGFRAKVVKRGYYQSQTNTIASRLGEQRTYIHEFTHAVQDGVEGIEEAIQELYAQITKGEKRRTIYHTDSEYGKLGQFTKMASKEAGRRDELFHKYQGKTYVRPDGEEWAKEIFTMQVETMFSPSHADTVSAFFSNSRVTDTILGTLVKQDWNPAKDRRMMAWWTNKFEFTSKPTQ